MRMLKLFFLIVISTVSGANTINIDKLLNSAKNSDKHLFLFLHKPTCSYCENMLLFTLPEDEIAEKIRENFIFVDIDIADTGEVLFDDFRGSKQEFAKYVGFNFYPSSLFIEKSKEGVYGVAGYKDEDAFLKILRYVETHSYKKSGIDDFK